MAIMSKLKDSWQKIKDDYYAESNLKTAIENNNISDARAAIDHAAPHRDIFDDPILEIIGAYSLRPGHDKKMLQALRDAVYKNYDAKMRVYRSLDSDNRLKNTAGHINPAHIYSIAARMNDVTKMRQLHNQGIQPDDASDCSGMDENIIMATAKCKLYPAMQEVIRQGASLDKTCGYDDFPPSHALSRPLFHALHPGVGPALLACRNNRITSIVMTAVGEDGPPRRTRPAALAF